MVLHLENLVIYKKEKGDILIFGVGFHSDHLGCQVLKDKSKLVLQRFQVMVRWKSKGYESRREGMENSNLTEYFVTDFDEKL